MTIRHGLRYIFFHCTWDGPGKNEVQTPLHKNFPDFKLKVMFSNKNYAVIFIYKSIPLCEPLRKILSTMYSFFSFKFSGENATTNYNSHFFTTME